MTTKQGEADRTPVNFAVSYDEVYTAGYIAPRPKGGAQFDAWLAMPDNPADKLIASGVSESWARYRVLRAYIQAQLGLIDATVSPEKISRVLLSGEAGRIAAAVEELESTVITANLREGSESR